MKSNIDIFESDGDDEESEEQEQSENGHEGDDEEENEDEDNKKIKIKKKKNKTSTKKKDIIDINEDLEEEQDNQKKTNNILYGILILGLPYETTELELKKPFFKIWPNCKNLFTKIQKYSKEYWSLLYIF